MSKHLRHFLSLTAILMLLAACGTTPTPTPTDTPTATPAPTAMPVAAETSVPGDEAVACYERAGGGEE